MSGPKNIRCRNFNDEGVGECDSGEYCRFVHPGPRWANARPYINHGGFDHLPRSYFEGGGGGGGGHGRQGGGGNRGPRRCRFYDADGSPVNGGCHRHPKGECRFIHPDQPGWETAASSKNWHSQSNNFSGTTTGSNSLPTGMARGASNSNFSRASRDTTVDTAAGSGTGFGSTETHQSPDQDTTSFGWGQSASNETEQPADGGSGWGGGWGGGETNHGWGTGETTNAGSGWGGGDGGGGGWGNSGGGGWGSSNNDSGSGGGGWGSSSKDNNATNTTQQTAQAESNLPVAASSEGTGSGGGWGNHNGGGWGSSTNDSGSGGGWGTNDGGGWGSSTNQSGSGGAEWGSSNGGGWGSSTNHPGSGGGGWGSSAKDDNAPDTTQPTPQAESNPPVTASSETTWGSSNNTGDSSADTWGSAGNTQWGWGSSNNTWSSRNEASQPEPASDPGPDKGKGKGWGTSVQSSGWSGWGDTSNSGTATDLPPPAEGGTSSIPATAGVTGDNSNSDATPRPGITLTAMNVDKGEPHFEGKAILNALENVVQRRRNKRKRSHESISQYPRYYRHLLAPQSNTSPGVDGDGDALMGETTDRLIRDESLEAGEITEVPSCVEYDMNVLSCEPKTSEEKTVFAKHLLYMFAEAAVAVERSRKAEKRYEDYKKSQEARMYNHPGHDARQVLMEKLHTLRGASCGESGRLTRILADLGALPSHHLSDVIAYNEHNHVAEETPAQEGRRVVILEGEKRLNERHDHIDRNLIVLQARLEELTKEKHASQILRDLPPRVDPDQEAVEEVVTAHQANVQRLIAVETSLRTITSVEENPHKTGPIQTLEESFPTPDCQSLQLQEFAEGLARLIRQVPLVRKEIGSFKAENGQRKETEKAREEDVRTLNQNLISSSTELEALNTRVTELIEGLKHEITIENVKAAVQPTLTEHTRVILEDVQEYVERGLNLSRELIREERTQMEAHIYSRLVGTRKLFEAVGCYLRSVRADLASLVDKDIGIS